MRASALELAFSGHPFKCLVRTLDPVLVIGSVGWKQLYDLIGAVGGHMADRTRREVDRLADLELVLFQRDSPELERHGFCSFRVLLPRAGCNIAAKSTRALKNPLFARN